jgi:hypothetical protein
MPASKATKKGVVTRVVEGTSNRLSGAVEGIFSTFGKVLNRAGKIATGTVHVAKDIVTLDGKNLKKDVRGVGRSAVGAVTNVAKGTVKTARSVVMGKEEPTNTSKKTAKTAKSSKSSKKSKKD